MQGDLATKISYFSFSFLCTLGFTIGAIKAWQKYNSEPVSSSSFEAEGQYNILPSLTICPIRPNDFSHHAGKNYTMDDMKDRFSIELALITFG